MTYTPRSAGGVALELWANARKRSGSPDDVIVVADELLTELDVRLRRWIGAEGYAALLNRSVALTLPTNPSLSRFSDLHLGATESVRTNAKSTAFTDAETSEAIIALLVIMMEQLGSIVGADMAVRLLALSGPPSTRGLASHDSNDLKS